jgi:hypothetical protein
MRHFSIRAALLAVFVSRLACFPLEAAEKAPTAEDLVQAALGADAEGNTHERARLLDEALKRDPNCALARWQSGYIQVGGKWLAIDDAAKQFADNGRLALYRQKRDALVDTADNHRELARWCRKNRLLDEERIHWAKVLAFEPQNAEAIAALGLKEHQGRLLTKDELEQERERERRQAAALRRWAPQVQKWRSALERGGQGEKAALDALAELSDPEALPALESGFAGPGRKKPSARLELLLVEVAARIPHPDATQVLLRRAVAGSGEVRDAACRALQKRPLHEFVPQLIAALPGKFQTQFRINTLPGGTVIHEHEIVFDGPDGRSTLTYESTVHPTDIDAAAAVTPGAIDSERRKAEAIEAEVRAREATARAFREQIQYVLRATTGFEEPDDPELLRKQYAEYYGWSESNEPRRETQAHVYEYAAYYPLRPRQAEIVQMPEAGPASTAAPSVRAPISNLRQMSTEPGRQMGNPFNLRAFSGECFPAGTPVLTISGARPIEDLKPGDRVLAQDLATGELAYKAVGERTLRQGIKLVSVHFSDSSITSTYGHPYWVVGRGWRVAGHLKPGDRLRSLERDLIVDRVEEAAPREVYNLVVSDLATFFVGQQRLLVHDDTALAPAPFVLPGLAIRDAAK